MSPFFSSLSPPNFISPVTSVVCWAIEVESYEIIRLSVTVPVSYAIDPFSGVRRASFT